MEKTLSKSTVFSPKDPVVAFYLIPYISVFEGNEICLSICMSKVKKKEFPFACVCVNFTSMAIQLLKKGKLKATIKRIGNVYESVNLCFFCLMGKFSHIWRKGGFKVLDFGKVKSDIEKSAIADVEKFLNISKFTP